MTDQRPPKSAIVTGVIAASVLAGTAVASALIWLLGDWQSHGWGLQLAQYILWGCCVVGLVATVLTRVTIIGWHFRRYIRPAEQPTLPRDPVSGGPRRPVRAPWYKSGALSFSMTVTLVSLAGTTAVASAVILILGAAGVFGDSLTWLILRIILGVFWVVCIITVLARVGLFRLHMLKAKRELNQEPPPAEQQQQQPLSDKPTPE